MDAKCLSRDIMTMVMSKYSTTIVNDNETEDSIVEHAIDLEVESEGVLFNVCLTVLKL